MCPRSQVQIQDLNQGLADLKAQAYDSNTVNSYVSYGADKTLQNTEIT